MHMFYNYMKTNHDTKNTKIIDLIKVLTIYIRSLKTFHQFHYVDQLCISNNKSGYIDFTLHIANVSFFTVISFIATSY